MKNIAFLIILLLAACQPEQEKITETEVVSTIEGLFEALDVENTNPMLLDHYITRDFVIYEDGQKMSREEFMSFVSETTILKSEWELTDFSVSTDHNSAHARLLNLGEFVIQPDSVQIRIKLKWLESAYLVKERDSLKIKFYFSDNIGRESDTIN
jgi:hypothetical protein